MKRNFVVFFGLLAIILYTYWGLWNTFFAQDEWASLGLVQANGLWGNLGLFTPLQLIAGKDRIFGSLLNNAFHYYVPFHVGAFAVFALVFHWANSMLVFIAIEKLAKNKLMGLLGALFFAVAATPSQAVTWISAYTTTLPNAFFVLLGIVAYLSNKRNVSILSFIVAYYFKESSIFLIFILPIAEYVFAKKVPSVKTMMIRFMPLFLFVLMIVFLRGATLLSAAGEAGVLVSRGSEAIVQFMIHAIVYPIIGSVQIFIPAVTMFSAADRFGHLAYEFLDLHPMRQAIQHIVFSDVLAAYIAIAGSVLLAFIWLRVKRLRGIVFLSLCFMFLSFVPFSILDRPASSYFESRYYYLGAIGASLLFAIVMQGLMVIKRHVIFLALVLAATAGFLYKQAVFVKRDVARLVIQGIERRDFLKKLSEVKGTLPDKPIIYIEGDSPGFYGIGDLAVPFAQGMGYTAMVWLFDTGKIPKEFLETMFLWNINSQGYQETVEGGFGYFYKKNSLVEYLQLNQTVSVEQVVAFSYVAREHRLINITEKIRKDISL